MNLPTMPLAEYMRFVDTGFPDGPQSGRKFHFKKETLNQNFSKSYTDFCLSQLLLCNWNAKCVKKMSLVKSSFGYHLTHK
jgi:hypothetical protein